MYKSSTQIINRIRTTTGKLIEPGGVLFLFTGGSIMKRSLVLLAAVLAIGASAVFAHEGTSQYAAQAGYAATAAGVTGVATSCPATGITAGALDSTVVGSSITPDTVYPLAVRTGTYSNITLPAANVAAGSLPATVIASSWTASVPLIINSEYFNSASGVAGVTYAFPTLSAATTNTFLLTNAIGKAGAFDIIVGTCGVVGSFTAAGVVTLVPERSSAQSSTTVGTATKLNVYQYGTNTVAVENNILPASIVARIRYSWVQ